MHTVLMAVFSLKPGSVVYGLHLVLKWAFEDNWQASLQAGCVSCPSAYSAKAMKESDIRCGLRGGVLRTWVISRFRCCIIYHLLVYIVRFPTYPLLFTFSLLILSLRIDLPSFQAAESVRGCHLFEAVVNIQYLVNAIRLASTTWVSRCQKRNFWTL